VSEELDEGPYIHRSFLELESRIRCRSTLRVRAQSSSHSVAVQSHGMSVSLSVCIRACLYESVCLTGRNGEPWWRQRQVIQKTMMSPSAGHVYLPVQNQVADDFIRLLSRRLDEGSGKLEEDITKSLTKYALEGKNIDLIV